ncbi:MAG: YbaB/EbfC family nucleoid-associated protein [Oscillospiraceae bacterium]|nr:YbaB/EbfC family nucleoid-associated protein [Oscillospiraceae bacterium]
MKARLPQGYGGGAAGNMQGMLKQAQKMQAEIARVQAELEEKEYTVGVGGGAVEVVMTGKKELKSLSLKPEVVDPEDIEMLQDLVISAVNEVLRQIEDESTKEMEKISGGMSVPGLF